MLSDEKFYERAEKFALLKNVDGKYFTFEQYKTLVGENQKDKNGDLIYWGSVPKNIDESQFAGMEFKLIKATVKENGFNKKQEPFTKILRPKFE